MALGCAISPAPDRFAADLLSYLDCQAATLGSRGFAALAAPGSGVALLLAALPTIVVALFGYRLLFGETIGVRAGVLAAVKVGVVLAFATSWPAYRTVVFDVVLRAPAELAGEIGRPAGLPGAEGGLAARIDGVDRDLRLLAIYGTGVPTRQQVEQADGVAPPLFADFDVFALGMARLVFLVGALGPFALLRVSAGLLLALGPLFVAFLLFDATRGIAEGWLHGLAAATLGSAAIAVALGIELGLLEPWLTDLALRRAGGIAIPSAPAAVLATATIFALAAAGAVVLMGPIAFGLRLPVGWGSHMASTPVREPDAGRVVARADDVAIGAPRPRAIAISDGIGAVQRRDGMASGAITRAAAISGAAARSGGEPPAGATIPIGQSARRRTTQRASRGGGARDAR
ncbi:type IV secretion system protein [Sphingomonas sp. RRHST34]|uniref:Type IV secretion system protein n=1 Tax=Sphingomonas citri TaxID=2862499 RepID=A0ABS7BQ47_9SPHN|nr:type IV secretion system protein [Sphingomonas citri]MBW6531718.1 type IV secretion system protein [Sphingomonas citri]